MSDANPPPDKDSLQLLHQFILQKSLTNDTASQLRELHGLLSGQSSGERISRLLLSLRLAKPLTDDPASQVQELDRLWSGETSTERSVLLRTHSPRLEQSETFARYQAEIERAANAFWALGETTPMPAPKASPSSQTTNTGMHDEANALIEDGVFDSRGLTPMGQANPLKDLYNAEVLKQFTGLVKRAREQSPIGSSGGDIDDFMRTRNGMPNSAAMRGFTGLMMLGTGIDFADAVIKKDPNRAAAVGTGMVGGEAYMAFALGTAGVASLPVAMAIGGAVGGSFDTYSAIKNHDTQRAVKGGIETTLYSIAAWAGAATVADVWFPPLGVATGTVALVAGGLGASMTLSRTICDHWDTVKSWFSRRDIASAKRGAPAMVPATMRSAKATAG